MNRRELLLAGAGSLAVALTSKARAQMSDMPGMSGTQDGVANDSMGAAGPAVTPIKGLPLPALPKMEAGPDGELVGKLRAAPATVEIAKGLKTPILAYNAQSPGPTLVATEGDQVRLTFINDVPDQESTIHWHGMPVPADQDGNPMDPVTSGNQRIYEFVLPEGSAGSYWYHPHPHKFTAEQVYRGLAGAFIVKPREDPIPASFGDTILFFTDLRLSADGTMPPDTPADLMNGREGDFVLVNGAYKPALIVEAGSYRRFRLYNATNARYLRISFGGVPFALIGSDGGLLERPVPGVTDILLSPAERAVVLVPFDGKQQSIAVQNLGYERGWMGPGAPSTVPFDLMTISVGGSAADRLPALPEKLRTIEDLGVPAVTRKFVLGETMAMGGASGMTMTFLINGKTFELGRIDETTKVGQVELWEIANPTDMDHPFHVHGTQFQVIEREKGGVKMPSLYRALKDTVNVTSKETVRIKIRQDLPGDRMYHCHVLEHEHLGMMGTVRIEA